MAGSRSSYQVSGMRLQLQVAAGGLGKSEGKQCLKDGWEEDANGMLLQRRPPIHTRSRAPQSQLHARRSSRTRGEATTTLTTTSTTTPTPKTQTIDLSALRFCLSEILRVLEPRARTILKLMHQFWQPLLCGLAVVVESGRGP